MDYDPIAKKYIEAQENFYAKHPDDSRRMLREQLGDVSGRRVLDLGCGAGRDVAWLLSQGADAIGVDPSAKMLEHGQERFPTINGHVQQVGVDDLATTFASSTFDLVMSRYAIHYAQDIQALFRSVHQVLKPGGLFVPLVAHPVSVFIAKGCDRYFKRELVELQLYDNQVTIHEDSSTFSEYLNRENLALFDLIDFVEGTGRELEQSEGAFKQRAAEFLLLKFVKR